jgi:hypothetical protein
VPRPGTERRAALLLAVIAAGVTAALYGRSLGFDLQCDDLLVIRPWSREELMAVWHGTWEPTGLFAVFFRPLSTWLYAGLFDLFGLNATAHFALSLLWLAVIIWLSTWFIARETGRLSVGVVAALVYAAHPNVPWSMGTWITNDFHKLTATFALVALLLWQRVRTRRERAWWPLALLVVACFLVKEDGVMLIPALLGLQWARARLVGDVRAPSWRLAAVGAALGVALVAWRSAALAQLGGFPLPDGPLAVFRNLLRGPFYAFALRGETTAVGAMDVLIAAVVAGFTVIGVRALARADRIGAAAGAVVMAAYAAPLALVSAATRYYVVMLAASWIIASGLVGLRHWAASAPAGSWRRWPAPVLVVLIAGVGAMRQQDELMKFSPCARLERDCVPWVLEIPSLPPDARAYVADTNRACPLGPRPRIGDRVLTWGLGPRVVDPMHMEESREIAGAVVSLIATPAAGARIDIRHDAAAADHPVIVTLTADGRQEARTLTSPEWTSIDVPLAANWRSWLRQAHRLDISLNERGGQMRASSIR